MSPFQDWFRHLQSGSQPQGGFEGWPSTPTIQLPPLGKLGDLLALDLLSDAQRDPKKYAPALVIGLGHTGERVLRQWLDQLAQDEAGPQDRLRAILVTNSPVKPLRTDCLPLRQLDLVTNSGIVPLPTDAGLHSRREEIHLLFRQVANLGLLQSYLSIYLRDLHADIRVVLLAGAAEPAVGLLGDVLQVLRLAQASSEKKNLFLSITVLLSLATPDSALDEAETYAALREIGRFTFSGWHWMKSPVGDRNASSGMVDRALLDQLFLLEGSNLPETSFDQGVGQAMAEALFALLHPAAGLLWENLANDLPQSARARQQTHQPVVCSLSVATLQVPLAEMRDYVATRLAYAALYSEHPNRPAEGLLTRSETTADTSLSGELLARRWLREGTCAPHLFEWLLNANGSTYFLSIPQLADEYKDVFQVQLAHGLTAFLNDGTQRGQLSQARYALNWLEAYLLKLDGWFKTAPVSNHNAPERLALQYLLNYWRRGVGQLLGQVEDWEKKLLPPREESAVKEDWRGNSDATAALDTDWRRASSASSEGSGRAPAEAHTSSAPDTPTLFGFLRQEIQSAESALQAAAGGQVRRAVTADDQDGLREAEAYYADTVRPELSHHGWENSWAFNRVRERLGWWVKAPPGREPQLFLLCLPAQVAGQDAGGAPPDKARFTPQDITTLGRTLLDLAYIQTQGVVADLTGPWLQRRLDDLVGFLGRANEPLLNYDWDAAADPSYYLTRRAYLMGKDRILTGRYKHSAFPAILASKINDLSDGEPARLTALGLWLNIPLEAIYALRRAYEQYFHQGRLHLYPQERLATLYERRIHALTGEWQIMPPELTLALVDLKLVTLFCQALFCGLIDIRYDRHGQNPHWTVLELDGRFQALPLASSDKNRGLWQALRRFTLELPNDPNIARSPYKHFSAQNRQAFLDALLARAQAGRRDAAGFRDKCKEFKDSHLSKWQARGQRDAFDRAFANLLAVELDEPLWEAW